MGAISGTSCGGTKRSDCLMIMKLFHKPNGEEKKRTKILVPDSAHGQTVYAAFIAGF